MKHLIGTLLLPCLMHGAVAQTITGEAIAEAAVELTKDQVEYDPGYYRLAYPMGDVPADRGVCTDVVIRAYRKVGIDLQVQVHEDMTAHFDRYPDHWGSKRPDPNIDHRRVPNLMVFFSRKGQMLSLERDPALFHTGDIVCWDLGGGIGHIGLVVGTRSQDELRPMIVHNIGAGQVIEDVLFAYPIIGHYRYFGGADQ